jgi:hypothetical protein
MIRGGSGLLSFEGDGTSTSTLCWQVSTGCWQEVSILCHVDLSRRPYGGWGEMTFRVPPRTSILGVYNESLVPWGLQSAILGTILWVSLGYWMHSESFLWNSWKPALFLSKLRMTFSSTAWHFPHQWHFFGFLYARPYPTPFRSDVGPHGSLQCPRLESPLSEPAICSPLWL